MAAPVLTPPPSSGSSEAEPKSFKRLWQRLIRNPYVLIALGLHLLLLLIFGGKVILEGMKPKAEEFVANNTPDASSQPPPPPQQTPPPPSETPPIPTKPVSSPDVIVSENLDNPFKVMPDNLALPTPDLAMNKPTTPTPPNSFASRASSVRGFMKGSAPAGEEGPVGVGKSTRAKFVCYVAQANGINPGSYHTLDAAGNIVSGPIPNLLRMINAWSAGRITAETVARPLLLSSDELFKKKPPFVYLAGFADFVLTDAEVANLHKYLMMGGAVWGDNGLAGRGSRFDIAFRREMKRVIPDVDKPLAPLPPDHPVYQGSTSFYQLKKVPPGMNYRDVPLEAILIDDEIAVIYTPNDYTDMMEMGFAPPLKQADNLAQAVGLRGPTTYWATDRMYTFQAESDTYFRNFTPASCEEVFRLSTNIVVHLLTRFQQKLQFTQ